MRKTSTLIYGSLFFINVFCVVNVPVCRGDSFADEVVSYLPGPGVVAPYNEPLNTLGPPDYVRGQGHLTNVALGNGGTLVLRFSDNALKASGDNSYDLWIFEAGPAVEPMRIYISTNGIDFIFVGDVEGQPSIIDIDSYIEPVNLETTYNYIKIIDANGMESESPFAGADIDAVGAFSIVDVPPEHWASEAIYKIFVAGITKGCSQNPLRYCPDRDVSKKAMAVFLLRSIHGGGYTPPPATGIFTDVPVNDWFAPWIEQLYREGITKGCSTNPLMYCPDRVVSKASMAVFLLRSIHGANYTSPPATGIFTDVPVNDWFAPWIEQLYREGITKGCSTNPLMYCPNRAVSKAAMALFLVRAFGL